MPPFDYNETVYLINVSKDDNHFGVMASVIAVTEDRVRWPYPQFPSGVVYTIEFEGGEAIDVHESSISTSKPFKIDIMRD